MTTPPRLFVKLHDATFSTIEAAPIDEETDLERANALAISIGKTRVDHGFYLFGLPAGFKLASDVDVVAGVVTINALAPLKRVLGGQVDGKTEALLSRGFRHPNQAGGQVFSLGVFAQLNLVGTWARKADAIYPILWPTLDDQSYLVLVDDAAFTAFYVNAFDHVKGVRIGGAQIKALIAAAIDEGAASAAANDTRSVAW
jgi:hypothetical protein